MTANVLALPVTADAGPLMPSVAVCAATGCTYRQLDFWTRCGYVQPAWAGKGSGTQRGFEAAEVVVIRRMVHLVRAGLLPAVAARAARFGAETWLTGAVKVSVVA